MNRAALLASAALLLLAQSALAYNIKLKDGSIIFARTKYEIKGKKAIITLTNGTVTQIDANTIDVPGTEQYNRENPGNVIAIVPGDAIPSNSPMATPPPTISLQDIIRSRKMKLEAPPPKSAAAAEPSGTPGVSWQPLDPATEFAFRKILDGAQITQYRLANYRGKTRLLATANSEEAVFNILSASARVLADLGNRGKETSVEIMLTTSSGESGGSFEMTSEQARLLVNGNLAVADYFIRHVNL